MPKKAKLTVHPAFTIGEISPRLYGSFLEPIGNWPEKLLEAYIADFGEDQ